MQQMNRILKEFHVYHHPYLNPVGQAGGVLQMKMVEEIVTCPWLTVYKAEIKIQDNLGLWGSYLIDPSPDLYTKYTTWCFVKTICTVYRQH